MRLFVRVLFISGLFLTCELRAQFVNQLSLDAIRIGVDPIRSWSMLFNANKYQDRPVFFNYVEGYVEFLVHLRTSVVVEMGYSSSYWNRYVNTFYYQSKGSYMRVGLDFNVTEPDPDFEVDIGWRLGANSFTENSHLVLDGQYWQSRIEEFPIRNAKGSTYWGEVLFDTKLRIFKRSQRLVFSNLWFHTSVRLRFKQGDLRAQNAEQYFMIPGYGLNHRIMPGLHFTLSYFIKIRERKVYKIHHAYDNKVLIKSYGR